MKIRSLETDDVGLYRALRTASFVTDPDSFSTSLEDLSSRGEEEGWADDLVTSHGSLALGAFERERLVGFVFFERDRRVKARHRGLMHTLYVDREQRGQGTGAALVRAVQERAPRTPGLEFVEAWVLGPGPKDFYLRLGFDALYTLERDLVGPSGSISATYLRWPVPPADRRHRED